jgi:hypothetical protein
MGVGQKEERLMFAGLGMALIGCVWFVLSVAQVLDGLAMMFGFSLGIGLAISGLIVSGVYFYRWQRIKKLLQGEDVLVKWANGESQAIITPSCAYVEGELYLWGIPGTRLEDVQIERQTSFGSERSCLQITLGEAASNARDPITGSRLWRTKKLSIRIPQGQELAAQTVLEQLGSKLPEK